MVMRGGSKTELAWRLKLLTCVPVCVSGSLMIKTLGKDGDSGWRLTGSWPTAAVSV